MTFHETKLPRAVLFDYDGVLVTSEPIHLSAWMQLLAELNLPTDAQLVQANVGKTAPEIISSLLSHYKPGWSAEEYDVVALALRKNDHYLSLAQTRLQPYPGVKEGIEWLHSQKILTAVVSNGKRRELEKTMRMLGLYDLFDQIVSRDDVRAHKPDPTPYLFAAANFDLEPQDCIAIEDSPTGLEAALMARIPSAGVTTNFTRKALEFPVPGRSDLKPIWIGDSMNEFFAWLKTLSR
jgi:beta-phosphoglucomutase